MLSATRLDPKKSQNKMPHSSDRQGVVQYLESRGQNVDILQILTLFPNLDGISEKQKQNLFQIVVIDLVAITVMP